MLAAGHGGAVEPGRRVDPVTATATGQLAVTTSTLAIAVLLLANRSLPIGIALAAAVVPLGAWLGVLRAEQRGQPVDIRFLAAAIGALLLLAVALAPTGSHDIWSYTMYGRMLSEHGLSPYSHVPHAFPHDPFLHLVARGWRGTPSVYGPVFVAFAAIGSTIAGGSALAARLFHEMGAAIAVTVALALIWRRTSSAAAVMLLGLNPLVIVSVVNGGHNDALVGLGVLVAVVLAESDHPMTSGSALTIAALIKVTALLALPAVVAWTLYRSGRRTAARLAGVTLGCTLLGYAIAGPAALRALDANRRLVSRASPWQLVRSLLALGLPHPAVITALGLGAMAVVGVLAITIAWRRRSGELSNVVVLAVSAYLAAGLYVLPWYVMWVLPVACLVRHRATLVWVASFGTFLTAVYVVKERALPDPVSSGWWWVGAYVGPVVLLAAFVLVARWSTRSSEHAAPRDPVAGPTLGAPVAMQ